MASPEAQVGSAAVGFELFPSGIKVWQAVHPILRLLSVRVSNSFNSVRARSSIRHKGLGCFGQS